MFSFVWKAVGGCIASALALACCKRGLQRVLPAGLSFSVKLFSLSLLGSTRSHPVVLCCFCLRLVVGNSPTLDRQSLGWVFRHLQLVGGGSFHSEAPDIGLLPYLLPFSSLWVSVGCRCTAFPVGSLPIRVLEEIPLQFFEVPPAFWGLGICLRLSGSRRFLSLSRSRMIWLAALGFRAFELGSGPNQTLSEKNSSLVFLSSFANCLVEYTTSVSPSLSSKTTRGPYIASLYPMAFQRLPKPLEAFSFLVRIGRLSL